jgi:chaperone modulatory protein CbpM
MQNENLVAVKEFCLHHELEMNFIYLLDEYGIIKVTTVEEALYIPEDQLTQLEKMARLHHDLQLNPETLDIIRHLLEKLETAQAEINELKNQLRFHQTTAKGPSL